MLLFFGLLPTLDWLYVSNIYPSNPQVVQCSWAWSPTESIPFLEGWCLHKWRRLHYDIYISMLHSSHYEAEKLFELSIEVSGQEWFHYNPSYAYISPTESHFMVEKSQYTNFLLLKILWEGFTLYFHMERIM